jgi:hypothetical protein
MGVRTRNGIGLKSKVTFIADGLQPNLLCLQRMRREYSVVLLSAPLQS